MRSFPVGIEDHRRTRASSAKRSQSSRSWQESLEVSGRTRVAPPIVAWPSLSAPSSSRPVPSNRSFRRTPARSFPGNRPWTWRRPANGGGLALSPCWRARRTEHVVKIALVGQQVFGFAEIRRRAEGSSEMFDGQRITALRHGLSSQHEMGADVLAERSPFAPFPGLEVPTAQEPRASSCRPAWFKSAQNSVLRSSRAADQVGILLQLA